MLKTGALCLTLLLAAYAPALAFDSLARPYLGVTLGTALTSVNRLSDTSGSLDTDFDPGYAVGMTAGIAFEADLGWNIERVRTEAEVTYRSSELARMNAQGQSARMNGTVSVTNFMLNGYLENTSMLSNTVPINLFLTAGLGGATASISSISYQGTTLIRSKADTQLAYQGGVGAGYELSKNLTLDLAYKYMGTTNFKFSGVTAEYGSHNLLLGARYTFGR